MRQSVTPIMYAIDFDLPQTLLSSTLDDGTWYCPFANNHNKMSIVHVPVMTYGFEIGHKGWPFESDIPEPKLSNLNIIISLQLIIRKLDEIKQISERYVRWRHWNCRVMTTVTVMYTHSLDYVGLAIILTFVWLTLTTYFWHSYSFS